MKYDPAKYLFLEIVQKANAGESGKFTELVGPRNVAELVVCFEFEVERVGSVLQFLGLADETRDGWLPNFSLMSIIAGRLTRQSKQRGKVEVTEDDRDFLARLYCLAAEHEVDASDEDDDRTNYLPADDGEHGYDVDDDEGDDDDDDDDDKDEENDAANNWCWNVLTALGLLKKGEGKDGGFKPTPRLKRLFESALEEHREELWGRSSKELSAQPSNILYLNTTRDPEVSDTSSTASVAPPQPDETPLGRSPPPRVASANSIEAAAATPGSSVDTLRARVVRKPVLGVTNPLSRRSTVPVPPFYSKRTGEWPATFRSAAAKQPDEKGVRLQNPVFRGQPAKVLRQPEPTKLSAKLPKLSNRKAQEKKAKRPSGDEPSDW